MRAAVLCLLLAACAGTPSVWSGREIRQAQDTPASFATEDGTPAVQECRTVMIDPRDNTRLRLIRSVQMAGMVRGDYEVPDGRYGVGENELLRLDCESGQVLGIVPN
jgi:hypothetical protein